MKRILVTGANGFIGRVLCQRLEDGGWYVRRGVRCKPSDNDGNKDWCAIGDIGASTDWAVALTGMDSVIHLAARAHVLSDKDPSPLNAYRRINVVGSERLAEEAASMGVRRLIYVSSIGVYGNATYGKPYTEEDEPNPHDLYAISKYEAEQVLWRIAKATKLELVIVRSPLVYGPDAPGNIRRLLWLMNLGIPLPFSTVGNRRSLIGVDNLADLLARCAEQPLAANQTFLAADGEDLSTADIIRCLAEGLGRPARLWPFPMGVMRLGTKLLGKENLFERLCGSLQVDASKARCVLGWYPSIPVAEGLRRTAEWYRRSGAKNVQAS